MSSGVPAQVGSSAEQRSAGPALLCPTDADLKVSATLPARVSQVIRCPKVIQLRLNF